SPETNLGDLDASCEWELDNAGETGWGVVVGFKVTGGRAYYDAFHDGTPLEGVGDAAVQEEVLVVRAVKGDTMFIVTYFQFPEPEGIAAQLARAIADNL
ncbi:MAG: hypothetical protein ABIZ52_07460, partial [Candidatus Limnocylindrales bacterium]